MRNYLRLGVDLAWVALSAVVSPSYPRKFRSFSTKVQAIVPYILFSVASAAVVFTLARLHRTVWRYTSLLDALHLIAAVTIALLLACWLALPSIDSKMSRAPCRLFIGSCLLSLWLEPALRSAYGSSGPISGGHQTTHPRFAACVNRGRQRSDRTLLILNCRVCSGQTYCGRHPFSRARVAWTLNAPTQGVGRARRVLQVIAQLEVHGVSVDRIVVMQPFEQLSRAAQEALLEVERLGNQG